MDFDQVAVKVVNSNAKVISLQNPQGNALGVHTRKISSKNCVRISHTGLERSLRLPCL